MDIIQIIEKKKLGLALTREKSHSSCGRDR